METIEKCRVCLQENLQNVVSLIEVTPVTHNLTLAEVYQYVIGVAVSRLGPQNICRKCNQDLLAAYHFKRRCERNEKLFENVIVDVKEEELESQGDVKMWQENFLFVPEVAEESVKDEAMFLDESEVLNFTCNVCSKAFENESSLVKHCNNRHRDASVRKRPNCTTFRKESQTKASNDQAKDKTLCPHCGKILKFSSLASHIEMIHKKSDAGVYICDLCGNNYNSKMSIANHLRYQHMKKGPIFCRYCPETFANDGSRRYHEVTIHTKDYKHICSVCGMKCYNSAIYKRHMISHTGEKPYMCPKCGARFGRKNTLSNHIATHTDVKGFICKICNAAFKTAKSLKTHQNVHQERKYECPVCFQKFLVNQSMRIHCTKTHPEFVLPPPGTVMNKQALKRMQELSRKRPQFTSSS